MKSVFSRLAGFVTVVLFLACFQLRAQTNSADITPQAVLAAMQRVADWQLAHPVTNRPTGWICAVGDIGMMALAGISGDPKYRDAMLAKGETNGWQLAQYQGRKYHADDQCYGQVCAELYFLYRDNRMIAPMREHFDWILANPSRTTSLDFSQPSHGQELWSWCDALFMAPTTWLRLYAATGDERYLNFAVTNWWRTTDYLYSTNDHLFFRDSSFFTKIETNGAKVFWSRGNGWVFAATVRMLQYLPMNHPDRPRFEQLFNDMAGRILSLQQPDGMWRASLLDPEDYPMPEASGSAMFIYGLAWGVNHGLLDRAKFEPAVCKAWPALVGCVDANGKLTHIQPAGDHPVRFAADSTQPYGGGVFLLAGSEVYRMAVLEHSADIRQPYQGFGPAGWRMKIHVGNTANFWRECDTVELDDKSGSNELLKYFTQPSWGPDASPSKQLVVLDGASSRILDSQMYSKAGEVRLLFQVNLAPHETRTFYILDATALPAVPPPIVKTMARYVPERFDDFAWESDRIAHRIYGQALIKAEGTISSGADVWIKKDRGLIVDTMYATKHYHEDNGSFMDDYRVGNSRGCGGLGIWNGRKLFVSSNWKSWKLITTGPIRSEFELTYDAWDAGNGRQVSEVKRFSIDAGSWLTKVSSTISSDDKSPLTIGVGLAERACPTNREEFIARDLTEGWMTYWQPEDQPKGTTAVAILLPKGSVKEFTNDNPDMPDSVKHADVPQPTLEGYPPILTQLAVTQFEVDKPFTYYFGACWDRSGDFTNHVQWEDYLKRFAERRDQPLQVTIGN
ncbi:MAG: glycoside hydrolase family 88 protein [Verrucomicrobiota bacterium]|jgi:rhamnogalacturonyl hydrolase YesR